MRELTPSLAAGLRDQVEAGTNIEETLASSVGGYTACHGLWRFYSDSWPEGGVRRWNDGTWIQLWRPFISKPLYCFGEDIFGNQLVILEEHDNAVLWDHESGELSDLYVDPVVLIETVLASGLDWIDAYSDGSLSLARQYRTVPLDSHLHWVTPLILGGQTRPENLTLVEREAHLIGHAQLWAQVSELPPGTQVVL